MEAGEPRAGAGAPRAHSAWLTPLLMVYYLCCWPQDANSDSSSERRGGRRGTLGHEAGARARGGELVSRRLASSAASLHLPSTSGRKEPLSAHRSHEEIGRRKSQHEPRDPARHHSAPSVIDEVLHRRDWERSSRELHIPLRAAGELSASSGSPEPLAEPDGSSLEEPRADDHVGGRPCKKHHSNIKSSKGKKERLAEDDKDSDATEASSFYIGDNERSGSATSSPRNERCSTSASDSPRREHVYQTKSMFRAKEAKQSFNELIRSKERPRQALLPLDEHQPRSFGFSLDDVIEQLESLDRSGAEHRSLESRVSLSRPPHPPPSVEAVGYEGGACYLAERPRAPPAPPAPPGLRARHASDGDILAPPQRPESGAFSESDLDLELEDDEPPSYEELHRPPARRAPHRRETAI